MDHDKEDGPLATPSDFLLVGIAMMVLWPIFALMMVIDLCKWILKVLFLRN